MLLFEENFSPERARVIADLFCSLGFNRIIKFDMLEPKFHTLKTLHKSGVKPRYLGLIAVCARVIDQKAEIFIAPHPSGRNPLATVMCNLLKNLISTELLR